MSAKFDLKMKAFNKFYANLVSFLIFVLVQFFLMEVIILTGLDSINILLIFITFLAFAGQTLILIYFLRGFYKYE